MTPKGASVILYIRNSTMSEDLLHAWDTYEHDIQWNGQRVFQSINDMLTTLYRICYAF